MKSYLISLLGAALLAAAIGILTPEGTSGGIGKHVRLITSLVILCVIALPLPRALARLRELPSEIGGWESGGETSFEARSHDALDEASRAYFAQSLTAHLAEKFSLNQTDLTCAIRWEQNDEESKPLNVTLILSGGARWRDPHELEQYVSDLLGCPCDTAIA